MDVKARDRNTVAGRRGRLFLLLAAAALVGLPAPASAQYFGRNKVQYDDFDFRVLKTPHFDIYFYPEEGEAIEDLARQSERWYERFARTFQHEFEQPKPLVIYANHPDFQQTNTLQGFIGEGTGGVTESLKNRVIMPLTGSYWDTDHVLGHELVHAFQYNIAQSRRGGGLQGLGALPLWLIEGMAEYLSVGREDPLTAMWMRDAILNEDFPTIKQMTREARFFPYRFGQALWAYIGGTYGDDAVIQTFRRSLRIGFAPAIGQVLGISHDTLSAQWQRKVEADYAGLMAGRESPDEVGNKIISPESGAGTQNVGPVLSPDGRYVAFLSEKDLFSVDLYLGDARTGRIIRKLTSANAIPHVDALRFIESAGSFSPDGERFAFVVFADGDNRIVVVDTDDGDLVKEFSFENEGIGAVYGAAWSPDGTQIAFTGIVGGISDLFVADYATGRVERLTQDKHADLHPAWSPDGRTIAFASDRGPETDFGRLTYSKLQIATIDIRTREVTHVPVFGNVRHSNPQFAPDGRSLYFVSDQDGFSDIYRLDFAAGTVRRVTRTATGVSGITHQAPALTVAAQSGDIAFSVFDHLEFHIHTLPAGTSGDPVPRVANAGQQEGRKLPPVVPDRFSRVAEYLDDPDTGLDPESAYTTREASDYAPKLALDYIGQPSFGVGADQFGGYVGGGASAYFSDLLGDQILGVAIQAQGTVKDIGGQVLYADLSDRWNWIASVSRIPYQFLQFRRFRDPDDGSISDVIRRQRLFITGAGGTVLYPFSQTRRVEFSAGVTRYSFDVEEQTYIYDPFGRFLGVEERDRDDLESEPLNLVTGGAAYVGDNSFFGFTSPVRGGRFRFELEGTTGSADFLTGIADFRRYFNPTRLLTVAVRGLHFGRYGNIDDEPMETTPGTIDRGDLIQPLFLGYETLVRGYSIESIDYDRECGGELAGNDPGFFGNCPTVDRLFGHRIAVASMELRVPLIGVEQFGLIDFPFLPTELLLFGDAGLAWDDLRKPELEFSTSSTARVPVFSAGVSARFNILGFMILEAYYAKPFQRPEKDWHWGFQLAPGW